MSLPGTLITPFGDPLNTTTDPLGSGEIYTGVFEQSNLPDVMVSIHTDSDCTLFLDYSDDNIHFVTSPSSGFLILGTIHQFQVQVKGPRYFRVRLLNGRRAQTYLRLYSYYGNFAQIDADDSSDAIETADRLENHEQLQEDQLARIARLQNESLNVLRRIDKRLEIISGYEMIDLTFDTEDL